MKAISQESLKTSQQSPFQSLSPLHKDVFSGRKINPSLNSQVIDFRTSNVAKRIPKVIEAEDVNRNSTSKQLWKSHQFNSEEDILNFAEFPQDPSNKTIIEKMSGNKGSLQHQQDKLKKIVTLQSSQISSKNPSQSGFKKNFLSVTCGPKDTQSQSQNQRNQLYLSNSIEIDYSPSSSYIYPFSYISHKNGTSTVLKSSNQSVSNINTTKSQQVSSIIEKSNISVQQQQQQQSQGKNHLIPSQHSASYISGQASQQRRTPKNGQLNSFSSQVTPQNNQKPSAQRFFVSPKVQKRQTQGHQTAATTPNQSSNEIFSKSTVLKRGSQMGLENPASMESKKQSKDFKEKYGDQAQIINNNEQNMAQQQMMTIKNNDQMITLSQASQYAHSTAGIFTESNQGKSNYQQFQILTESFPRKEIVGQLKKKQVKNKKKKDPSLNSKGMIQHLTSSTSAIIHSQNNDEITEKKNTNNNVDQNNQFLFSKQISEMQLGLNNKREISEENKERKKKKSRKQSPFQVPIQNINSTSNLAPSLKRRQNVQQEQQKSHKSSSSPLYSQNKSTNANQYLSTDSHDHLLVHRSTRQTKPTLTSVKSTDNLFVTNNPNNNNQKIQKQQEMYPNKTSSSEMFNQINITEDNNIIGQTQQKIKLQKMIEQQKQIQESQEKIKRTQYLNEINQQIRQLNLQKSPKRDQSNRLVANSAAGTSNSSSSGQNQSAVVQSPSASLDHKHAWGVNQTRVSLNGNPNSKTCSNGVKTINLNDKSGILRTSQGDSRNQSFLRPMTQPSSPSFNNQEKERNGKLQVGLLNHKDKQYAFGSAQSCQPTQIVTGGSQIKHISQDNIAKKKNPDEITEIQKYMALKKKAYEETEHMREFERTCKERKIQESKTHLESNIRAILRRIQPTTKKHKKNHTIKTVKDNNNDFKISTWFDVFFGSKQSDMKDLSQFHEYYPLDIVQSIQKNKLGEVITGNEENNQDNQEKGNYSFLYQEYKKIMTESMSNNNSSYNYPLMHENNDNITGQTKSAKKIKVKGSINLNQQKEQEKPQSWNERKSQIEEQYEVLSKQMRQIQESMKKKGQQNQQQVSEIVGQTQGNKVDRQDIKESQETVSKNEGNKQFIMEGLESSVSLEEGHTKQIEMQIEKNQSQNEGNDKNDQKDDNVDEPVENQVRHEEQQNNMVKQDHKIEDQFDEEEQNYIIAMQYLNESAVRIQKTWRGYQIRKLLSILLEELRKDRMSEFLEQGEQDNDTNNTEIEQDNKLNQNEQNMVNREWLDKQDKQEVQTFFMKEQQEGENEEEEEKIINISTIKSSMLSCNEHIPEDITEQLSKRSEQTPGVVSSALKSDRQQVTQNDGSEELLKLKELEITRWNAIASQLQEAFSLTPHHRQSLLQELQQISETNKNQLINSLPRTNQSDQKNIMHALNDQAEIQAVKLSPHMVTHKAHQRAIVLAPAIIEQEELNSSRTPIHLSQAEEIDDVLEKNNQDTFDEEDDVLDESHQHHQSDDMKEQDHQEECKVKDHELNVKECASSQMSDNLQKQNQKDNNQLQDNQNLNQLYFLLSQESNKDKDRKYCSYSSSMSGNSNQTSQKNSARVNKPNIELDYKNNSSNSQSQEITSSQQQQQQQYQSQSISHDTLSPTAISKSFFERDSFKLFTEKKLKELQQNNQIEEIAKLREESIKIRHSTQIELMNKMLQDNTVTPRTYFSGKQELDQWAKSEQDELKIVMLNYDQSLQKAIQSISKTQRDFDFTKKYQQSLEDYSKISISSPQHQQQDNNLNNSVKEHLLSIHNQLKIEALNALAEDSNLTPALNGKIPASSLENSAEEDYVRVQDSSPQAGFINTSFKSMSAMSQKTNNTKDECSLEILESKSVKEDKNGLSQNEQVQKPNPRMKDQMWDQMAIVSTPSPNENDLQQDLEWMKSHQKNDKNAFRELNYSNDSENIQGTPETNKDNDKNAKDKSASPTEHPSAMTPGKSNNNSSLSPSSSSSKSPIPSGSADKKEDHGTFNAQAIQVNEVFNSINDEIKEKWKMNAQVEERLNEQLNKLEFIDKSDRYGIPSNIFVIDQYLLSLFDYVKAFYKDQFIENINTSFGFTPQKRLKLIHGYDSYIESTSEQQLEEFSTLPFVLSEELFIDFEQNIVGNGEEEKDQIIKEFQHIHNKAIFDTFNESLNLFRPFFSLGGSPYAWSKSERNIIFWTVTEDNFESIMDKAKKKVIEWASFLCGIINEHESNQQQRRINSEDDQMSEEKRGRNQLEKSPLQSLFESNSAQPENEYFAQTREERLSRMLLVEIFENEYKWQLYEDEKAEVLMELSDLVFEELVEELVDEIADSI